MGPIPLDAVHGVSVGEVEVRLKEVRDAGADGQGDEVEPPWRFHPEGPHEDGMEGGEGQTARDPDSDDASVRSSPPFPAPDYKNLPRIRFCNNRGMHDCSTVRPFPAPSKSGFSHSGVSPG